MDIIIYQIEIYLININIYPIYKTQNCVYILSYIKLISI